MHLYNLCSSTRVEKLFVAVGNAGVSNKMAPYTTKREVFTKTFWYLVSLALLGRENIVESFMFVLCRRETVCTTVWRNGTRQKDVSAAHLFGAARET
jgi:hypothetical protein